MQIRKLDHVNLRTAQLDIMIEWYTSVLGLRNGDRPNFPLPGAWLYAEEAPVVHIVGVDGMPGKGSEGALKLEHFAFSATGRAEFEALLEKRGERFKRNEIDAINVVQLNIWDPDGNHIHVDFTGDE